MNFEKRANRERLTRSRTHFIRFFVPENQTLVIANTLYTGARLRAANYEIENGWIWKWDNRIETKRPENNSNKPRKKNAKQMRVRDKRPRRRERKKPHRKEQNKPASYRVKTKNSKRFSSLNLKLLNCDGRKQFQRSNTNNLYWMRLHHRTTTKRTKIKEKKQYIYGK